MAKRPGASGAIVVAALLGGLTAYLVWNMIRDAKKSAKEYWVPVVMAKDDIQPRTKISEGMVYASDIPPEHRSADAITNKNDVVGKFAKERIRAKDQLRACVVGKESEISGITAEIPPGMVAVAIGVDEVKGVGNTIQPKDHIHILTSYNDPILKSEITKIILQNVKVLAIDQGRTDSQTAGGAKSSITLALRPEDVELVKAAERAGVIQVALCPVETEPAVATAGVKTTDILPGGRLIETPKTTIELTPARNSGPRAPDIKIYHGTTEQVVPAQ